MKILMYGEKFNPNREQDVEKANLEKHKDKLTAFYLTNGDERYIYDPNPDFRDVYITPDHRNAVIENMKNGVDYSGIEKKLLKDIAGPEHFYGPDGIFNNLADDKHQKKILTYMTGGEWNKYDETNGDTVSAFLGFYPTPMDFEDNSKNFLQMIERANGERKGLEYKEAMEEFKKNVYGKKYEYYKAMQDFHREVGGENPKSTTINTTEIANQKYEAESRPKNYIEIDRNESIDILRHTNLEGGPVPFSQDPTKKIPLEKFLNSELEPRFQFQLESVSFNTSRAFKLGSRDAVICYVNTPDGRISARSYYRSNSQGVWRYLPDYEADRSGDIDWYGKGCNEQQLTLPMEIQGTLNDIAKQSYDERRNQNISATNDMKECFFGTAKRIPDTWEYNDKRRNGRYGDALDKEVNSLPSVSFTDSLKKLPPEAMHIGDNNLAPNFSNQVGEFKMRSGIYGDATVRLFKSNDGELTWSFIEDSDGKVCIGGIEMKSEITSTGLRQKWVNAGDFAMPLYEYESQDHNLGDFNDRRSNYVGMWKNCLSKMPVIQAYKSRNNGKNE